MLQYGSYFRLGIAGDWATRFS